MANNALMEIHNKYNRIVALLVLALTMVVFFLTMAPTLSFWDCGEYVASARSLGVPHPPGNPLYILLGRVFTIFFGFIHEVAFRINLMSVIAGGFTAMLLYLAVVRSSIAWMGVPDTLWKRLAVYVGGVVGGLFAVFGVTFWFSAVEASETIPSMLGIALGVWMVLVWAQSKSPTRDRILIFISYLTFLGIGIHVTSMMVMGPLFLFIIMCDEQKRNNWRLWLTAILMGSVLYSVSSFIWLGPATVLFTLIMSSMDSKGQKEWRFSFWIAFFALLGYSVHMYIPIRAALNPIINENAPYTLDAFRGYLERKQYGSENMILRMFHRRGALSTQFGFDGHMGFGGFLFTQFFRFSVLDTERAPLMWQSLIYLVPVAFTVFGWFHLYKRNKNYAILLGSLLLMGTVVFVLYMNFADGLHAEKRDYMAWLESGKRGPMPTVHREVRVRDYFFTSGFMFYGMWMGLAATALMHMLFTSGKKFLRTTAAPIVVVLFAVSPALPIVQNFTFSSRVGDWVPYDYAYNLLMSCDKDGILFTNGDNDTFPLWALQEAYGIRKDVRIVNLSLLNTDWYIKQLKELEPKVPITYSNDEIKQLNHELNPFEQDTRIKTPISGILLTLPGRQTQQAMRVQDKMVLNIVDANRWRKPIYFAVTVSNDNRMGLDPYLKMEGLVYRVMQGPVAMREQLDVARTVYLLNNVYRYRGLGTNVPMNETTEKLLSNYAAGYIQVALVLREPLARDKAEIQRLKALGSDSLGQLAVVQKQYDDTLALAIGQLNDCVGIMPWDWRLRTLRHQMLIENERYAEAESRMREALVVEPGKADYLKMLAQALDKQNKQGEANEVLRKLVSVDNDPWSSYASLAQNYADLGAFDSAIAMLQQFQQSHPGDRRAATLIRQYQDMLQDVPAQAGQ